MIRNLLDSLMSSLRIYRMDPEGPVGWELAAYRAGIDPLTEAMEQLEGDLFVETAGDQRLAKWERLLGFPLRQNLPDAQNRRRRIISSLSLDEGSFTMEGILTALLAAGMDAWVEEDFANHRLLVHNKGLIGDFGTIQQVIDSAKAVLPAHLEAEFDLGGVNWTQWEQLYASWSVFDQSGKTFGEMDVEGILQPVTLPEQEEEQHGEQQQNNQSEPFPMGQRRLPQDG